MHFILGNADLAQGIFRVTKRIWALAIHLASTSKSLVSYFGIVKYPENTTSNKEVYSSALEALLITPALFM